MSHVHESMVKVRASSGTYDVVVPFFRLPFKFTTCLQSLNLNYLNKYLLKIWFVSSDILLCKNDKKKFGKDDYVVRITIHCQP